MSQRRFLRSLVTALLIVLFVVQATWVLAGTTGSIQGTVIDKSTSKPIAGAKVTAASPGQVLSTTSDASGHFTLISLAPDTYTLTVEKSGFTTQSQAGITVQSDQTQSLTLQTAPELKTIGRIAARGSGSLVRSGVTSDVYSVTPAQQAAAAPLGGGNNLNSAYSAIASVPGAFVPIGDAGGWGQTINLRGGDYTQTGNEVDGIPINRAFDQYAGSPLSNLGNAEVQVYTGNQPAEAQANGLAGFVNQVIRTGTYPGFTNAEVGVGGPGYYHKFSIETGGATSNRNLSYYAGFLGYNQQNRYVDQFNGSGLTPIYGSTINYIARGCNTVHPSAGCYLNGGTSSNIGNTPIGPNGFVTAPTYWGSLPGIADREGVANIHIGLPHAHDGGKDDIQLLYNTGETYNAPNSSLTSFGSATTDVVNGTVTQPNGVVIPNGAGGCPATSATFGTPGPAIACAAPAAPIFYDQYYYTGPLGTKLTAANLGQVQTSYFAGSPTNRVLGASVPRSQADSETTGFTIGKVQYQHNFGSTAYARVYGYTNYSDRIDNGIVGDFQNYVGAFTSDYVISSHTRGTGLIFADQLNPQNLLTFNAGYSYSNTSRTNNLFAGTSPPIAYLVNSANPTAGCYTGAGALHACSSAARYVLPSVTDAYGSLPTAQTLVPTKGAPVLGTEGGVACGGAPCEYLAVNNGGTGSFNSVRPAFTNASISDSIKPSDKLTINASLRFEDFTYNLQQTNTLGNQLLTNDYNISHCVSGATVTPRARGTACPAGTVPTALTAASPARLDFAHVYSPRFGLTYDLDPNTVFRASYGRFTQPAETSAVDATNIQSGAPSGPFYANFGFPSYARPVEPEISYNTDFSIERAFPQSNVQLKLTPFFRKTTNEFVSILVDPRTNFIANINGLNRKTQGVEFALSKGDFRRDGFAAQLSYTYTHATTKFKVFSNGGSFVGGANLAIQQYNGYTKFCATNPTSKLCGATNGGNSAAPCYTLGSFDATGTPVPGVAAPGCGVGTVANPYWNASPQGLLDPNSDFIPYNVSIGPGDSGGNGSSSYIVPHVIAFVLSYKKGPLTITPSVQFEGGARYGSPFVAQGVAPDTCLNTLPGAVAADPRYSFGSPGPGSPYDASSCTSVVPIPNPQTSHFDGIGEFVQPNLLATNVSLTYDFTKRVSLNIVAANVLNRCFGGSKVPWNVGNVGCAYVQSGTYAANVYNPGDAIQGYASQSYVPNLGGALQSVTAGSPLPFELYMNLRVHM